MKNKTRNFGRKYPKPLFLVFICWLSLVSCIYESIPPYQSDSEIQNISFRFSSDLSVKNATEYETITRATGKDIMQLNGFGYIISEKMEDGKYLVADVGISRFNLAEDTHATLSIGELETRHWEVSLRPGEYSITLFTCVEATEWNTSIRPGDILDSANPTWAMTYTTPNSVLVGTQDCLLAEIFCGTKSFTVEKSKDLHSPGNASFQIDLRRKVAKFRALFSNEPTPAGTVFGDLGAIMDGHFAICHTQITDISGRGLPDGLDVFGNAYYNPIQKRKSLYMVQSLWKEFKCPSYSHTFYMSQERDWQYCPYVFTDTKNLLQVKVTYVEFACGRVGWQKRSRFESDSGPIYEIENNGIYGYMMRLTDATTVWPGDGMTVNLLEPVIDGAMNWIDPTSWLEPDIEFN